jgi:4-amino-4-deoxy-L-arabinose transferase-like glycosyltransferase
MNDVLPMSDFNTYHIFAEGMSQGKIIGKGYIALYPSYISYPAFLSIFYYLLGVKVIIAQFLNVIFSAFVSVLIYLISKESLSKKVGITAALLWAFWPSQIFYSVLVCTEIIFVVFMLLCIYLYIKLIKNYSNLHKKIYLFSLVGIMISFANAIRPLGLILIASFSIYLIIQKDFFNVKIDTLSKFKIIGIITISYFIILNMINFVTSLVIEQKTATRPFGYNLYVGLNLDSKGVWNQADSNKIQELRKVLKTSDAQKIHDEFLRMAEERFNHMTLRDIHFLFMNKFEIMWLADTEIISYIKMAIDKTKTPRFDFYKYHNLFLKILNIYYYAMLILSFLGTYNILKQKRDNIVMLFCILLLFGAVLHTLVEVAGRYHFPYMVLIAIIGAYGLKHKEV